MDFAQFIAAVLIKFMCAGALNTGTEPYACAMFCLRPGFQRFQQHTSNPKSLILRQNCQRHDIFHRISICAFIMRTVNVADYCIIQTSHNKTILAAVQQCLQANACFLQRIWITERITVNSMDSVCILFPRQADLYISIQSLLLISPNCPGVPLCAQNRWPIFLPQMPLVRKTLQAEQRPPGRWPFHRDSG